MTLDDVSLCEWCSFLSVNEPTVIDTKANSPSLAEQRTSWRKSDDLGVYMPVDACNKVRFRRTRWQFVYSVEIVIRDVFIGNMKYRHANIIS